MGINNRDEAERLGMHQGIILYKEKDTKKTDEERRPEKANDERVHAVAYKGVTVMGEYRRFTSCMKRAPRAGGDRSQLYQTARTPRLLDRGTEAEVERSRRSSRLVV